MNLTGQPIHQKAAKPVVSKLVRNASRNETCTLMIPGVCCGDPQRVVGCHLRLFTMAGMGQKPHDAFIVDACDRCHAAQEDRSQWSEVGIGFEDILRALMITQSRRIAQGLITVAT